MPMIPPFMPSITPLVLPSEPFEKMVSLYGMRFTWLKSHDCPCTYSANSIPGQPDTACNQCHGRGIYWDTPFGPVTLMITYGAPRGISPTEPGAITDPQFGITQHAEPKLTIPYMADPDGVVWNEASIFDAFVEIDSTARYNVTLVSGSINVIPYQQGLTIATSGAVTIYDPNNHNVSAVSGYTVSGARVSLPAGYPQGTGYTVEFTAQPVYVIFRRAGGFPHVRPAGLGVVNVPRSYHITSLDMWLRARTNSPGVLI